MDKENLLATLSKDLFIYLVNFMDMLSFVRLGATCKSMNKYVKEESDSADYIVELKEIVSLYGHYYTDFMAVSILVPMLIAIMKLSYIKYRPIVWIPEKKYRYAASHMSEHEFGRPSFDEKKLMKLAMERRYFFFFDILPTWDIERCFIWAAMAKDRYAFNCLLNIWKTRPTVIEYTELGWKIREAFLVAMNNGWETEIRGVCDILKHIKYISKFPEYGWFSYKKYVTMGYITMDKFELRECISKLPDGNFAKNMIQCTPTDGEISSLEKIFTWRVKGKLWNECKKTILTYAIANDAKTIIDELTGIIIKYDAVELLGDIIKRKDGYSADAIHHFMGCNLTGGAVYRNKSEYIIGVGKDI
jgi:hypothetical protein